MNTPTSFTLVVSLIVAFILAPQTPTQADAFGSGADAFTLDFVNVGNTSNAADTTGYGSVPYEYRIGTYEISQDAITKATAGGLSNVTAGAWTGNRPAANISWYEAAAFVNWLNTSTGRQAAYDLAWNGSAWSMSLWSSGDAWQLGGENLYRHKDAYYFLPSENEWYKASYYSGTNSTYFLYPTASSTPPIAVASGTDAGTAVYSQLFSQGPAEVNDAGGPSPYGTIGQGGNVYEWTETALDGVNDSTSEFRARRGGLWEDLAGGLVSSHRDIGDPADFGSSGVGFRVASVPEPSTYALLLMTAAGAFWWAKRRK
jgi:formylglycine-generating enzyme required for sulfatase activity